MKVLIKILLLVLIFTSCNTSNEKYKDVSSSEKDIEFYDLVKVRFQDDTTKGHISIPKFLVKGKSANENNIFYYFFLENKSAYLFSIDRLKTRNTEKLTDKQYLDITNDGFENEMKGDLSEIERILSPIMKNVKVAQFDGDLIINNKYFLKRISYFQDKNLEGTYLQEVNCTNFHFVTLHNKTKYSFNINYCGDDKSIAELSALFNTIGGSISFN
tara:strand:- start:249 stop:893 length:645 start_codon:yes stop_codon:yes gene_type:complete